MNRLQCWLRLPGRPIPVKLLEGFYVLSEHKDSITVWCLRNIEYEWIVWCCQTMISLVSLLCFDESYILWLVYRMLSGHNINGSFFYLMARIATKLCWFRPHWQKGISARTWHYHWWDAERWSMGCLQWFWNGSMCRVMCWSAEYYKSRAGIILQPSVCSKAILWTIWLISVQ